MDTVEATLSGIDMEMQPLVNLFAQPVWFGHYDGDLSAAVKRAEDLFKNSDKLSNQLERDGAQSSVQDPDQPHTWPEMQDLMQWIGNQTQTMWHRWSYANVPRFVHMSWVNNHPPGGWTDEHDHGSVPLAMAVYLKQPKDGGNLLVQNPLSYHWSGTPRTIEADCNQALWREIPVETGDVVMFPGWLLHKTGVNLSNEDRIVMSMNVRLLGNQV